MALGIGEGVEYGGGGVFDALDLNVGLYLGWESFALGCEGADVGPPLGDVLLGGEGEGDGTVEAAAGVPSAALFEVAEADFDGVRLAGLEVWGGIYLEGVVAVDPVSGEDAVDAYLGLCHGSVEVEECVAVVVGEVYLGAVVAVSYPWEGSRTA